MLHIYLLNVRPVLSSMLVVPQNVLDKKFDRKYVKGELCLQEHLFEHFNSEGHNGFLHNVLVALINKTDGKNPTKREHYWRHNIKTLALHDLNVDDVS